MELKSFDWLIIMIIIDYRNRVLGLKRMDNDFLKLFIKIFMIEKLFIEN